MLSPAAEERVQAAIDAVRSTARAIVKAADVGAIEIDRFALAKITESRTAFLDLDESADIKAPDVQSAAIDFEPESVPVKLAASAWSSFDMEV
jgi:hypothetical protein